MDAEPTQENTDSLIKQMTERQRLGQSVLQNKQEILIYEQKREKCREAVRQLEKNRTAQGKKSWFCVSETTFLKFPTKEVEKDLHREQETLREKYNETREEMKVKMSELKRMDGEKDLETMGFGLRSVNEPMNK